MRRRLSHPTRSLSALAVAALLALTPHMAAGQDTITGTTLDGATFEAPAVWVMGETLLISGEGWTNIPGNIGSVIGVKYDQGETVPENPVGDLDDVWLEIGAAADGSWSAELPFPENAGWAVDEVHSVHLLTGLLGVNDKARNPVIRVTLVEADTP